MKPETYGTLGSLKVKVLVYDSVEEADKEAGKVGAVLESANDNFHYRGGPAADTREWICDFLEKETGIERKTKPAALKDGQPKKDDKGEVVLVFDENEGDFARRICATKDWKDLTQFQPQLDAWALTANNGQPLAVNAKAKERKPVEPKKLAAKFKIAAAKVIANGTLDKVNANQLTNIQKTFTATGDTSKMFSGEYPVKAADGTVTNVAFNVSEKDAEALGWLIKEYMTWKETQTIQAEF